MNEAIRGKIVSQIDAHLAGYGKKIQQTLEKSEDGSVSISLAAKLSDLGNGEYEVETQIGFSLGKVKDKWKERFNPNQLELPT